MSNLAPLAPTIVGGAVCYRNGFKVDADGCPRAYNLQDTGLDYLENARDGSAWVGVVLNASGVPVQQGPADPYPGYFVSCTSLVDPTKSATDPSRYADSEKVPYISIASDLKSRCNVRPGDLAWVLYNGLEWGAVIADVGPHGKYGEGSIALANQLSIPSSCRWRQHKSGVYAGVTWIVFPGSALAPAWPQSNDTIVAAAQARFVAWGGEAKANALGAA